MRRAFWQQSMFVMHRTKDGPLSGILSSQGHPRLVGRLRLSKDLKLWGLIRLSERLKSLLCIWAKVSEIELGHGCCYNMPRRLAKAPVALVTLGLPTATSSLSRKVNFLKLLMLVWYAIHPFKLWCFTKHRHGRRINATSPLFAWCNFFYDISETGSLWCAVTEVFRQTGSDVSWCSDRWNPKTWSGWFSVQPHLETC